MRRLQLHGFTLIELMVALAVVATLTMLAMPSIEYTIKNARIKGQASDLYADLQYARSQAVSQGLPVIVCASDDGSTCLSGSSGWEKGRMVFVDVDNGGSKSSGDTVLRVTPALGGGNTLTTTNLSALKIVFRPAGNATGLSGGSAAFKFCDSRGASSARTVTVSTIGMLMVSVGSAACP